MSKKPLIYGEPVDFTISFIALNDPKHLKYIITDKIFTGLTFKNNSISIKVDSQEFTGSFSFTIINNILTITMDNPAINKGSNANVVITFGTTVSNVQAIIDNNYIVTNNSTIEISGMQAYPQLITKSNTVTVVFEGSSYNIYAVPPVQNIPSIDNEKIYFNAYFTAPNTTAQYQLLITNEIIQYLDFLPTESVVTVGTYVIPNVVFTRVGNIINIQIPTTFIIMNQRVDIKIATKINNGKLMPSTFNNKFTLNINGAKVADASTVINLIQPIAELIKSVVE